MQASIPQPVLPEWFLLLDPDIDGTDFNWLILLVLRRLDAEFPNRVNLSNCNRLKERVEEFSDVWNWLERQEIINGPIENCSLTLAGRNSYRKALELASDQYRAQVQSREGLRGNEAKELVMNILRQFFTDYGERKLHR